ncbi:MAG TPA: Xaa-Pro peptidase family protein [Bacteroidota bacterium]|nr:Xaa-Pro peptidase family protein [Bacteroidota bacterium]
MKPAMRACLATVLALLAIDARGGISGQEYAERRARLAALADTDAAVVFHAAGFRVRSGDVSYHYRQESNFLYLTGFTEPDMTLMIVPRGVAVGGVSRRVLLFAPAPRASAIRDSGTFRDGAVLDASAFDDMFRAVAGSVKSLYLSPVEPAFFNDWINDKAIFLDQEARQRLRDRFPSLRIRNAGPLVTPLRERKSAAELDLIRSAIRMTGDGIRRAMTICRPGAMEYELQAAVEYEMYRQGADYTSFPSIIGSGPNSVNPHYEENRRAMRPGEIVVVDVGADFDGYSSDVTRTLPVSGTYTRAERKVYATVLKAQEETIRIIRPGLAWSALEAKARSVLAEAGFGRYMPHAVSHHVGIDVHDTGSLDTLAAGMVITVEPGIYVPLTDTAMAPEYRGFGVRIEDDVLVTPGGSEVLSAAIPKDIATMEKLVRAGKSEKELRSSSRTRP